MTLYALLQILVGAVFFAAAGYFSSRVIVGESRELVEKIAYTVLFGLLLPPLLLLAANLLLGIKLNDLLVVYGAYGLVAVAGYLASLKRSKSLPSSRAV